MDKSIRMVLPLIFCVAFSTSCRKEMPPEYKAFFDLPREQLIEKMRKMPTDKQIDYYLAGQEYFGPPINLNEPIIERGKEALPFLLKRLEEEEKDYLKMSFLYTLRSMHYFHYDLRGEKEVIETLNNVAAKMEPGMHKEYAENIVKDIVENRPPDLERFKKERPHIFPNANRK